MTFAEVIGSAVIWGCGIAAPILLVVAFDAALVAVAKEYCRQTGIRLHNFYLVAQWNKNGRPKWKWNAERNLYEMQPTKTRPDDKDDADADKQQS